MITAEPIRYYRGRPYDMRYIHKEPNGLWKVEKAIKNKNINKRFYFGEYKDLNEAKKVRDHAESINWKKTKNPLRYITKTKDNTFKLQKSINKKPVHFHNFKYLPVAQYFRDKYEEYGWDKQNHNRILTEFQEYYTNSVYFYKYIYYFERYTKKPWVCRIGKYDGQKTTNETICTTHKLEDCLWERDLTLEYGEDYQSYTEDTRPNPYKSMKLPYYFPKGKGKLATPPTELINITINLIQRGLKVKEISEILEISSACLNANLRKYSVNYSMLKKVISEGTDPYSILDYKYKLLSIDHLFQ